MQSSALVQAVTSQGRKQTKAFEGSLLSLVLCGASPSCLPLAWKQQIWALGGLDDAHHHVLGVTVTSGSYSSVSRVAPQLSQRSRVLQ